MANPDLQTQMEGPGVWFTLLCVCIFFCWYRKESNLKPLKIKMEPNNEGLVQMIFLFELDDFQVPDVDLLASKQEQFELIYF